jgi:hypothetical protein
VATGTRLAGARNGRERVPEPAGAGPAASKLPAGPTAAAGSPPAKPPAAEPPPDRPAADAYRSSRPRRSPDWFGGGVSPTPEDIWAENDRHDRQQRNNPPEPAPPAARDHRPRGSTNDGGPTVSASSNPYGRDDGDFTASAARTIHRGGGSGEIQSMLGDMPRYAAEASQDAEAMAANFRRKAAEVGDGTASRRAVVDAWLDLAAAQSQVAQQASELEAVWRSVEADAIRVAEEKAGQPAAHSWLNPA